MQILVVDDDVILAQVYVRLLEMRGHSAHVARSAHSALEHLENHEVDLVVSDLHMPQIDGQAFWHLLRRSHPLLAREILFVSGELPSESTREFLRSHQLDFLQKPFGINDFLQAIDERLQALGLTQS